MSRYGGWLLIFLVNSALLAQQPIHTRYTRYDVENGLPQNLVSGIVQDEDGFIWVTTMDGLARFDGKEFLTLKHKPDDSASLSYNSCNDVVVDRHNNLWVQFNVSGVVNKINPRTFQVSKPTPGLLPDKIFKNRMRGGTLTGFSGDRKNWLRFHYERKQLQLNVELWDTTNNKLKKFLLGDLDFKENKICAFSEDANGKLWLVTGQGLVFSDNQWENFKTITFPPKFHFDPDSINFPVRLFHLSNQRIAMVHSGKVIIYSQQTGVLKETKTFNRKEAYRNLSGITSDPQGRLVFEYQRYVYRLEDDDTLTLLWIYPGNLPIRAVLVDRTNTLWVGTDPDGLYRIDLQTPAFVSHLYQDDFISDILINEIGVKRAAIPRDVVDPISAYYSRYAYTDKKELVLHLDTKSIPYGLFRLTTNGLERMVQTNSLGQLTYSNQSILMLDDFGYLYQWRDLNQSPSKVKTHLPLNDNGAAILLDMIADGSSYWVSTRQEGIHQFQNEKIIKTIRPQGNYAPQDIRIDPKRPHILWVATVSGGLYEWDNDQNKLITVYNTENGLPNNTINCIVVDSLGYMWMSTNKGITRLNPTTKVFTNYTVDDGLVESEFNRHHEFYLPDGRIAMGGTKGYSVFNPKEFKEDTFAPEVYITRTSVNGKLIDHKTDSITLPKPVNQLDGIELTYSNNSIGFEIAATQFNAPEKIKYRYKLEGYDKEWVPNGTDNRVRFNLLPYGRYILLLNASNTAGVWNPNIRRLAIVVYPPFWLTWWAYSFYAIIIGLIIRSYWKGYKRRLKAKQDAELNIREAARLREVDEMKTRFFSNITHEFRTPLTLILSPLEKHLQDGSLPPRALTLLNNNYRHASQLLKLVNQLLDIAKLEAGQLHVNSTAGELVNFAEQCVSSFQTAAKEKNIELTLSCKHISGHYLFDHEKWEKILFNLLSNAIKFTPEGGSISVSLTELRRETENKSVIQMQVKDSGIGINSEQLPKIFERFYQVDDSATREHEGTGIGLALVKELVDLLKGNIQVNSTPGKGTSFTVELPVEKLKEIPSALEVTSLNGFHLSGKEIVHGIDHDVPVVLVVEDNDELRSFIKESITTNWKVLEASNGLEAWSRIEQELPEIVISDVMMPGMNGFELCRKSKHDHRTAHINFIMLTAKAAHESKIEGLESGADEYLTKPFHLYELELRIRNLLQEQSSLRKRLQEKLIPRIPVAELPQISDIFLTRLRAFLDTNLDNSALSVDAVANAMAMSKSTLNRKLKSLLNTSVSDFIRQYRLQKANGLLLAGHHVNEVAYQVGFETPSYFTQCFKESFGHTPTEFMRAKR